LIAGRIDEAERICGAVLVASPRHAPTLALMAKCQLDRNRLDDAISLLHRAVAGPPGRASRSTRGLSILAPPTAGMLSIKNGNHSAAQICCHFAATAFPARPD
jgi:hypothetical protein